MILSPSRAGPSKKVGPEFRRSRATSILEQNPRAHLTELLSSSFDGQCSVPLPLPIVCLHSSHRPRPTDRPTSRQPCSPGPIYIPRSMARGSSTREGGRTADGRIRVGGLLNFPPRSEGKSVPSYSQCSARFQRFQSARNVCTLEDRICPHNT